MPQYCNYETSTNLVHLGETLAVSLCDESRQFRQFVTMNSNAPTTPTAMRKALQTWYNQLNNKTYRDWKNRPQDGRWQGWAFLEGFEGESEEKTTLHWHMLIGPGPALEPERYADMMTPRPGAEYSVSASHMMHIWKKLYPRGSTEVRFITELPVAVEYATKGLRRRRPHLNRNHEEYTTLPYFS